MDLRKATFGLFLKTYHGDLQWLPYLFRSINKYVTGFSHLVITTDNEQEAQQVTEIVIKHRLHMEMICHVVSADRPHDFEGYVFQQYVKLKAFDYLQTDFIMYLDSDCLFQSPFNPMDMFFEGKPVIFKTHYSRIESPWKSVTEQAIGQPVEWEYMRRHPFMYIRETLVNLFKFKPNIYDYTKERSRSRNFSEFNFIGAYAETHEPDNYHFHDTEYGLPDPFIHQNWSWGGLTDDVKQKMEDVLK